MASRGAWPFFYTLGMDRTKDPQGRDAHGIYAFKKELVYNGFGDGMINLTSAYWGSAAVKATKQAQAHFGLVVDGVLGPATARCLFRARIKSAEGNIPEDLLQRIASLESGYDPVAQGYADPHDEGLFQENLPSHPELTQTQCWTPSYIIPLAAQQLLSRINACHGSAKAGAVAWNVGDYYANKWQDAGYPTLGGPVVEGQDMWSRATQYWTLLGRQEL